ncbi:MAG: glycosyl hydrolase family 25 [Prevotella sp.]|nr:glycosyl hydrolase family 25 [Prevotella sp.]
MKKIVFCILISLAASSNSAPGPALKREIGYYMERHNLQDEGYEMVAAFAGGKLHQVDIDRYVPIWNVGRWHGHRREGTALALDSLGRTVVGTCRDDSLITGIRVDTLGNYTGDFHEEKSAGHGAYTFTDARGYYEGHWSFGHRDGFGLAAETLDEDETTFRVGIWRNDRFMGERMRYTTERIYGIDISRYQHGKGRKKFPIYWDKLRITNMGKRGSQNVSGTADYPVSFVYIKSTEGTTIRNQYYANDYAKARKQGIRVGAYHFWSIRRSGAEQAQYFIRNTIFRSGDLPPVLDIEPSDAQIKLMGGEEKMFEHIRTWLRIVERHTGVKPILYVNQRFVNNHLSKQTDLKRDYSVWIARYSEYKPDVKLTYWQLSSDGRVAGIQGDVDINVFNGYQSQFESFLEETTIK